MTMAEAGEDSDTGIKAAPASNSRPPGAELSAEEEAATRKFLENVNKWRTARQLGEMRKDTRYNKARLDTTRPKNKDKENTDFLNK